MDEPMRPFSVVALQIAKREGRRFLTDVQYEHIVEIERRLAWWPYPEEIADLRIEKIGDLYELKEKWGPLGRINFRAYFGVWMPQRQVVIVKSYKKEEDDQTPRHVVIAAEDRFDDYKSGLLREGVSVHTPYVRRR